MIICWYRLLYLISSTLIYVSSASLDSIYLDLIQRNISDYTSLNNFYRSILQDLRQHRLIDTVASPINLSKIRSHQYDEEYIKTSCYETASDLLIAHGYDKSDVNLSISDLQSLLPAILYTTQNPGCSRKSLPTSLYSLFSVWILGLIVIFLIKLIHLLIFAIIGDRCLLINSVHNSKNDSHENPIIRIRSSSLKYRLWVGLCLNSFTCGLMLGTAIYHLIPHIYAVPNENFDYIYLLRATIIFFGVYLFFIVEKLLRFRFKIDETQPEETHHDEEELHNLSDTSIVQMAKMHGTLHTNGYDDQPYKHSNPPARIPLHTDSDDEDLDSSVNQISIDKEKDLPHHHESNTLPHRARNLIFYHLINDFSNDLIYGCGLCTAFAHDYFIGSVISFMIFIEGFRRHSQTLSIMSRQRGVFLLLISIVFLLCGYLTGGFLIELNRRPGINLFFIEKEYIYSIVYGALFYTALVTLIPELNTFGHRLQMNLKKANQTTKQRRLIKVLILICQNLFLIIGVIIALVLASIWRYYHRIHIYEYVCNRDSSRIFCHRHSKF
ncbi:unnamed protein product [Adineta ricciae]|uniref:Uncharacterized protein n=1 Tax=Adineta ricciae TaxID=249248 RepID=A0A815SPL5_ADIRI|nr:unnamed protein product [Adineta ricciae]